VFSELVIVLEPSQCSYVSQDAPFWGILRAIHDVRPFKLAFLLEVSGGVRPGAQYDMMEALKSTAAKGLLDFLDSPPTIRTGSLDHPPWFY